jgi:voltage-gated potassium channel
MPSARFGRAGGLVRHLVNSTDTFRELTLLYVLCLVCAAGVCAAGVFALAEDKTFGDSLWWSAVTAMTVGYGDYAPVTTAGRLAGVALMHLVPLFIIPLIIVRLLRTFVRDENEFTHAEQEAIRADLAAIKKALKIDQ